MRNPYSCSEPDDDRIAVVVPCYDAAATLAETLESALEQEGPLEIIVVDDGSRDESLAVARRFSPAVQVVSGENRGASAARNRGVAETGAPWILFLDADDILAPGTLARRRETARGGDADVIVCDWREFDDDPCVGAARTLDWTAMRRDAEHAIAAGAWATTAAILYRRALVERIGGFRADLSIIQDARFFFDAAAMGGRFTHSPHLGASYRLRPQSLSRRDPTRFLLDVLSNGKQIEESWRERGVLSDARLRALMGIYNVAGRGLFSLAHEQWFEAVAAQRSLGLPLPRHSRVMEPLARVLGLRSACFLGALAKIA
jgi:glycosyltransferase involved in cell wall biosynthesis